MSHIKGDNPVEQKHFDYLEELRQSGEINMWGAASYLHTEFPEDFKKGFYDKEASATLLKWMKRHKEPGYWLDR